MPDKEFKKVAISLSIGGMTCVSCVANVEEALKMVPGVKNVVVNLATEKAAVEYNPSQTTLAAMKKAVEDIGY
ncbi:MAG: heavy metal-associated domain-containing protein, partial [Dehalococcoidales bacterium]|nr:heavy metal-associated domain-containing protein [Dehalococcoidales bacterium]